MSIRTIAGDCTVRFEGRRTRHQRGRVLVVVKPDDTVLVHDVDGYQPVAWLTRPESVTVTGDTVAARDGDQSLRVTVHDTHAREQYPLGEGGVPVGTCPNCASSLVRSRGTVACPDCDHEHPIPSNATVLDEHCTDCGLPQVRVERGCSFVLCPGCDSLTERVRAAFDREWGCPDCEGKLRVLYRGGLLLGCDRYPDCEVAYGFPRGTHEGACACGLPTFEWSDERREKIEKPEPIVSDGGPRAVGTVGIRRIEYSHRGKAYNVTMEGTPNFVLANGILTHNTSDAQSALRRTMEQFSNNVRFILSCNYSSQIIDPIQSRCAVFRFSPLSDEAVAARVRDIASQEGIDLTDDGVFGGKQDTYLVGVNWHLNSHVRFMANYNVSDIEGGPYEGADINAFGLRAQVDW
jgi:DNA topoisomerase-1